MRFKYRVAKAPSTPSSPVEHCISSNYSISDNASLDYKIVKLIIGIELKTYSTEYNWQGVIGRVV